MIVSSVVCVCTCVLVYVGVYFCVLMWLCMQISFKGIGKREIPQLL